MIVLASSLLLVLGAYLALGVVFALAFSARGAQLIDPAAAHMPAMARLLILPGAMALWPLLLLKWLRRQPPPVA